MNASTRNTNQRHAEKAAEILVLMEQIELINTITGTLAGGIGAVDKFASDTNRRCIALRNSLYSRYERVMRAIK